MVLSSKFNGSMVLSSKFNGSKKRTRVDSLVLSEVLIF